ncbi:tetratricopeptide repeat protein, partial [Actinoplanes nipponensis]
MTGAAGGPTAPGERSVAAGSNYGTISTGDDPRFVSIGSGELKSPEQVPCPAGLWNVPRRPSRVFVGRDTVMNEVAQTLASGTHGVIGQSVTGLGGVGKTEVALHHAHACRDRYTGVWWVGADSGANLTAGLAALAHRLAPATTVLPDDQAEAWAIGWLNHHDGWLLILDNVEEPGDIQALLGGVDGGRVLITTRRDIEWTSHGLIPIRLGTLTQAEAVQMLSERTGQDDRAAAAGIAAYLGCLPLALEQAAAYINHHRTSMAAYHDRLHDEQAGSLLAGMAPGQDAQRAVTRVWAVTLDALTATNPGAVEILRVLAWLAPDDIPRDLITALTNGDQTTADLALGLLASYSMITLDTATVSTHRLVQTVVRLTPPASQTTTDPSSQAIQLLNTAAPANPGGDPAGWPRWRDLLPHITTLTNHLPHSTDTALGRLLNETGVFERSQGLYQQAELHSTQALAITEAARGSEHPDVAVCLGNLAVSYSALGRAGEAVPLFRRALAITEAALGPEHPSVAIRLGNLAGSYRALGRAGEAVPLEQRALAITEAA